MNKFFTTLLTLAAISIALPAALADCEVTTSSPEVDTGETGAGQFYIDNDACQPECLFSIWGYQETNGIAGLQRGDEVFADEVCGGESDLNIF